MNRIRPITKAPGQADISIEGIQQFASMVRSVIAMLQEAHEVLGVPIPDKNG